ncbi:nucleotidyltransferase [Proteiniclasticum sp. C24MP]|uniref:nucleotidyltransferase n=1 Tax=Proteiniclasticum sp. C24MP TaxID=3374101 RepID=UPI003753E969
MRIAAIISEYNPFHKGHEYQIRMTRTDGKATHVIALMSGNFVQRGLPAIIDKYRRAEMALLGGADLVLELPGVYALSSAEFFAEGSIRILNALNGVHLLSFGSEEGRLDILNTIAEILAHEPDEYKELLKEELQRGHSFPKARNQALKKLLPQIDMDFIQNPNNILGVEYLKAMKRTGSKIQPFTVQRIGKGYHDLELSEEEYASATALRNEIHNNESIEGFVPDKVFEYIEELKKRNYPFISDEDFKDFLIYRLITEHHSLIRIQEANEGLDNRILSHLNHLKEGSLESFIDEIKTKRYTRTRISRILMQFLLAYDLEPIETLRRQTPETVKILALNEKGQEILAALRKDKEIGLEHNFGRKLDPFQKIDQKSSLIYAMRNPAYDPQWDFKGFRDPKSLR